MSATLKSGFSGGMYGCARTPAEELGGLCPRIDGPSVPLEVRTHWSFAASIEPVQEFVGVLARTHSRGVHFGVLRSECFPRTAVELFAKGGPRALSMS